jgi:ribonucleoside-diphosphate reductase alpha chain
MACAEYVNEDRPRAGQTFAGFKQSRYASGEYFNQYLQGDWQPKTDKVRTLFAASGITLPTREMWRSCVKM